MRHLTVPTLACLAVAAALLPARAQVRTAASRIQQSAPPEPRCAANPFRVEPLLMYDLSGSTLLGPAHTHLTLYSDGRAALSMQDPVMHPEGAFLSVDLSAAELDDLRHELLAAGVDEMCDEVALVLDAPRATLTFFEAFGSQYGARTVNYTPALQQAPWSSLELTVQQFLEDEFTPIVDPDGPETSGHSNGSYLDRPTR